MIAVGQVLCEKYRLVRLVGDGGMGSVYEAEHLMLGTRVAIKVLHPELARRPGLAERFMQEARVSAQIKSPHVVQVHDVDRTPAGEAFLVMELLQGEPLSARIDREKRLDETLACELGLQMLEALSAAHELGVVHRDLKPDNVFLTHSRARPFVKVIDFGIAKLRRDPIHGVAQKNLTAAGVMMGTAEYMAPEQAYSADQVDARADIYSVGVMLYEMLSGTRPVMGDDARVIAIKVERGEVKPLVHAAPGVRPELAGLVHRAISSHPDLRFQTALEMMQGLSEIMGKKLDTAAHVAHVAPAAAAAHPQRGAQKTPVLDPGLSAQPPAAAAQPEPPKTGTQMAAPLAPAYGAPLTGLAPPTPQYASTQYHGEAPNYVETPSPSPQRKGSRAWLYVLMPLLVGAGAVGAFVVYSDYYAVTPGTPLVAPTTTLNQTQPTPTAPVSGALPGTTATGAAPLTPPLTPALGPYPQQPSGPSPGGSHAPGAPSAAPSPSITPLTLPSGFPSAFPSAFPFPVPSNGTMPPFQIPSSFPQLFPPAPPAQPQPVQPVQPGAPSQPQGPAQGSGL